ncbi:MAG: hypothetical protein A3G23_01845 [Bacteroidetes bacterium RIFCSPLOWO2_12_FULL_37_12]|nr:MAG: hypothetical protein A3G23_01845 [Bacteroidetes bacterium RIFCSPLOWO2_12_FULL_37_12]
MDRDSKLSIPPTSFVPQDSKADVICKISLEEGESYIGKGVMFKGFTTDKKIPGPTFFATEGDIVEFIVENKGKIPHGASLHMAYTQTSKYLGKIEPEKIKSFKFRVSYPGVYMYHCAPGGHAIPMHIIFGQYGMMVVKAKKKFKMEEVMGKKPDVEIYLIQHEFYSSGKEAVDGHPLYTVFNGKIFRYVDEPIKAKPGDFVRIYFLNAGPNLISTFHIVGIIWDYAYWQGNPENIFTSGQSALAGPSDSWILDFRMPPDEGAYLMLSHAVGSTDRGAIGILMCDKNADTPVMIKADGPEYSTKELAELKEKSLRTISPFEPGTPDIDPVVVFGPDSKEVTVKIIGNSFFPKRIQISKGTKVKWLNEDVFSYFEGEYAGIHDIFSISGEDKFKSPLLAHAETFVQEFKTPGEMKYICTPHPYMRGEITVVENKNTSAKDYWTMGFSLSAIIIALGLFLRRK